MATIFKGSRDKIKIQCTAEFIGDHSRIQKIPFHCIFQTLPNAEAKQVLEDSREGTVTDLDIANKYLVGWEGVEDSDNQPIEFSPENVAEAMEITAYRAAIITGFMTSLFGKKAIQAKN